LKESRSYLKVLILFDIQLAIKTKRKIVELRSIKEF